MQNRATNLSSKGLFGGAGLLTAALLAATSFSLAKDVESTPGPGSTSNQAKPSAPEAPAQQLREGTTLKEVAGHFKAVGDRLSFYADDGRIFNCLENLSLERINKAIGESPDGLRWTVSATVTEYHGANYLLITHAILNNRRASENRARTRRSTL